MVKIRSKLKRHPKGRSWGKGQSSVSNPSQMKHRLKAKSRFFQPNLHLAPNVNSGGLTQEAVLKHEQRQMFKAEMKTVNEVSCDLESFKISEDGEEDETMSETQNGTFKTFKTFASDYSSCTNMSFKKLLLNFRTSSELHKEMLAILTALTEIIKERGGTESSTEYYILLMEQIESSTEESDVVAGISLLAMGIKSVPTAVLRKAFSSTAQTLMTCLERFVESGNYSVIRNIIGCFSVILRAQEYAAWTHSSTWKYVDAILSFTVYSKPKVRKAAQRAIISIILGSSFMLPKQEERKSDAEQNETDCSAEFSQRKISFHPAGERVAKFCLNQFKPEMLANSQTTVLHTLTLLKDTVSGFKMNDIRSICENLLSIMTAANVLIRTNCFQVLYSLFNSRTTNLGDNLCAKLIAALYEYQPNSLDIRQTLAWLTVLKEGHIHLAQLNLTPCVAALPIFVDTIINLWLSDHVELIVGISNCIKEVLYECIKPACATKDLATQHRNPIVRVLASLGKMLNAPFGDVTKYVILTFSVIFEVCGGHFGNELTEQLTTLAQRYDVQSALRVQIEHAIIAAIKAMGVECVLKSIPLQNTKGEVLLEKSWLLPLLREGTFGATFKLFKDVVLPLALNCNRKWNLYASEKQIALAHTYELLCCQIWGLFPGFCRQPKDPENFSLIAPTLGNALDKNPEFRAPIFDGLVELIQNESQAEIHKILGKYAKNFLPRLFNIYTQKPNGTYETDLRKKSLEVIKLYLKKTPKDILKELYETAKTQLSNTNPGSFEYDSILDITVALVICQSCDVIRNFFESFVVPILKNDQSKLIAKDEQKLKKQQRKVYELLFEILVSEVPSCKKFSQQNIDAIQNLLQDAFTTSCSVCQALRLKCLKSLIENRTSLTINDKIIMKTIPEAVIPFKQFSNRKENISEEIIKLISNMYQEANKLNDLVDILMAGFAGDESLITNTILAFRTIMQCQGKHLTPSTLEFMLEQVLVFLVQKSRSQAEASVAFLITFIKVMPAPLVSNHLQSIMQSLSAMTKDTKRYCRIQIGFFLKKLCKRFTVEELTKFVPGDDEVTHRRLKKIRKQMRRDTRKKLNDESKDVGDDNSDDELLGSLEKKSVTIDDILSDSESDLSEDNGDRSKSKKATPSVFIREDPEEIVDLADSKSIGNILMSRSDLPVKNVLAKSKEKDINRGFKTADDGRLIISDAALRGHGNEEGGSSEDDDDTLEIKAARKRGMESDSSDAETGKAVTSKRGRKTDDTLSMRSGKTSTGHYTVGGKGIHRPLGGTASVKSGYSAKSNKSVKIHTGSEYTAKKAKGDMKKKGKLDPYAYIPLSRNTLNKRKRSKNARIFKNMVGDAGTGKVKGVRSKLNKKYKS